MKQLVVLLVLNVFALAGFLTMIFADFVFRHHYVPFWETWNWYFGPAYAGMASFIALINLMLGKWWFTLIYGVYAGFGMYLWWMDAGNRRRRHRLAARAARLGRRAP